MNARPTGAEPSEAGPETVESEDAKLTDEVALAEVQWR